MSSDAQAEAVLHPPTPNTFKHLLKHANISKHLNMHYVVNVRHSRWVAAAATPSTSFHPQPESFHIAVSHIPIKFTSAYHFSRGLIWGWLWNSYITTETSRWIKKNRWEKKKEERDGLQIPSMQYSFLHFGSPLATTNRVENCAQIPTAWQWHGRKVSGRRCRQREVLYHITLPNIWIWVISKKRLVSMGMSLVRRW